MRKKVLLVCGAGISTSIITRNLQETDQANDFEFACCDVNSAPIKALESDLVILAPHVKFIQQKLEKICERYQIPLFVIKPNDYMRGDVAPIFNQCKAELNMSSPKKPLSIIFLYEHVGYLTQTLLDSKAFQAIVTHRNWDIKSLPLENFKHDYQTCVIVEPQLIYLMHDLISANHHESVFESCPAQNYLDLSGKSMENFIQNSLKRSKV